MEERKMNEHKRRIPSIGRVLVLAFLGFVCFLGGIVYTRWRDAQDLELWRNDGGAMGNFLFAIESYSRDHEGWCPPDLTTLEVTADLPPDVIDRYGFHYFGSGKRWSKDGSAIVPIMATEPGIRQGKFILVGYNNGSVHFLHWAPGMIKDLIKESHATGKNGQAKKPTEETDTFVPAVYKDFPAECPLHAVPTVSEYEENQGVTTSTYGVDYTAAQKKKFPCYLVQDSRGHPDQRIKKILIKYCPECRKAWKIWYKNAQETASAGPVKEEKSHKGNTEQEGRPEGQP